MAKSKPTTQVVKAGQDVNLPAHLQNRAVKGLDVLSQYIRPSLIKIVQKQASDELLSTFNIGDVILTGTKHLVASHGGDEAPGSFFFTPLFMYPEWCTWSPIKSRGQIPMILFKTQNPNDAIVAKSRDSKLRFETIAVEGKGNHDCRHVEHLNFIVVIHGQNGQMDPAIMSFSKGEHGAGERFSQLIKMRKAGIYAGVYQATIGSRSNADGEWKGLNITIPKPEDHDVWVDADSYERFEQQYEMFAEKYAASMIISDYDEDVQPAAPDHDGPDM